MDIEELRELVSAAQDAWQDVYREAELDLEFYDAKNQWDPDTYNARINAKRHAITVNRLPQFVRQVVNDIRQNTPTIKVLPASAGTDEETAEVLQDIIRNIEYVSKADVAYDTAVENSVKCSLGWIRIEHGYTAPDTFEQEIAIKRVVNALSAVIDPNSIEPDGSDARYGIVFDSVPKKQFKKNWPKAKTESFDEGWMTENASPFWLDNENVMVAEIFVLIEKKETIYQLENGEVVSEADYGKLPIPSPIVNTREISKDQCMRYKCSGCEILEEGEFPSSYIPLVPVYGEEHWIRGKRHIYSLIRNAKESQRLYNYRKSLETEMIQKAPKAPYMAAEGQLDGYEDLWRNPEAANVLIYKSTDVNGTPVAAPHRIDPIMIQPGLTQAALGDIEDMKAVMGIHDASLGSQGNETSGKAIIARQREGDTATYHFADNLNRSITGVGRIILDMIPRIYDTPRILRTLSEDGSPSMVGTSVDGEMPKQIQGIERIYDICTGKYDAMVVTGPSYATKRIEAAESMLGLTQANPALMQIAGDLIVEGLDFPNKDALAKRIKKTIPPQLLEDEEEETPDLRPQLQQAEQMMQQAAGQIQQLQQQIGQLEQEKTNDAQKNAIDAAKIELDRQKLELEKYKLAIEEEKVRVEAQNNQATAENDRIRTIADLERHKVDTDSSHTQAMIAAGSYIQPEVIQQNAQTEQAVAALTQSLQQLGSAVEMIGQNQSVLAAEVAKKPKRIDAKRDANGNLYAEVTH